MVNVYQDEIDKFAELAHRWWDPDSEFKPLHDINPLRVQHIDNKCGLAGKRILDVGCGGGILSEAMAQKGASVTGIDLGEKALQVAKLHQLESNVSVDYRLISVEAHAIEQPALYDVVTCMEMLEHVPDPVSVVKACAALVRPGGHVFFSTLNRNPKSYLFAIIAAEYLLNLLPRGTHQYEKMIKPSELANAIRQTDLQLVDMIGLTYHPITKRYQLTSDISVNYIVHCRC